MTARPALHVSNDMSLAGSRESFSREVSQQSHGKLDGEVALAWVLGDFRSPGNEEGVADQQEGAEQC